MNRTRAQERKHRPGRRLTALAVSAVLTATGGSLATVPAATAATSDTHGTDATATTPAHATDAAPQEATVRFPQDSEIVSAGTSGFLSRTKGSTPEHRWTRYADGTSTVLPAAASVTGGVSDVVVAGDRMKIGDSRFLKVYDMAAPAAAPVEVHLDELGADYTFAGAIGRTLVFMVDMPEGGRQPHLVTVEGGSLNDRVVSGMPTGPCYFNAPAHASDTAVFGCRPPEGGVPATAVVDMASATVVSRHDVSGSPSALPKAAVSDTHVAWYESNASIFTIHVARRGTAERIQLKERAHGSDDFRLVGGWVTRYEPRAIDEAGGWDDSVSPPPPRPFVAESAETGETIELLLHASSSAPAPDGSLMVRGGTPETGEGLYRVALGAEGKPEATMVAPTGQASTVTLLGTTVPSVLPGAQLTDGIDLSWDLSRGDAYVWVRLTHVRTGDQRSWRLADEGGAAARRTLGMRWDGMQLTGGSPRAAAPNGEYTWELTARPDDGIGPELRATGRFSVTRPVGAHDYNDNGTPDVLVRDVNGLLVRVGMRASAADEPLAYEGAFDVGPGWQVYDRLESVGNVAATSVSDAIARDRSGVLWLYEGTGTGTKPFLPRKRIGGGWGIYDRLAGGSDLTDDGRADVVATDRAGVLWLYSGTGNANAPFSARKRIGGGWGVYNELTAVGNLAGAAAGDLVARDKAGVLWLYLGKGDGTFASRTRIGAGWNTYTEVIGIGDGNGDGRSDLLALKRETGGMQSSYFYAGTGDWRVPFKGAKGNGVLPALLSYETGF